MENKRKIPKRIFSLFLAILCAFGVFFVSFIDVSADTFSVTTSVTSGSLGTYYIGDYQGLYSGTVSIDLPIGSPIGVAGKNRNFSSSYYWTATVNGISLEGSSFYNPTSIPYSESYTIVFTGNANSYNYTYFIIGDPPTPSPSPTPTPAPATPTPAPATPTPNPYGPGPVPTIPPGDQSYTDFFTRLASDAQSAFNAIFLSWNNANSRFYSGIFFIGFPILLGIIGLVASIFFGDDD